MKANAGQTLMYGSLPASASAKGRKGFALVWALLLATCLLCWVLTPAPDGAIKHSSPLPLGALHVGRGHKLNHHVQQVHNESALPGSAPHSSAVQAGHLQQAPKQAEQAQEQKHQQELLNQQASSHHEGHEEPHMQLGQDTHLQRHKHLEQQQQQQQQGQQQQPPFVEGVDIVYLWVNGSDPEFMQVLNKYSKPPQIIGTNTITPEGLDRSARYDSSRDELRYSLRSLEQYMPWYRHIYLVTNGQVPSWLDLSNPRLTVVPHSTIFEDPASQLPTFNSNAIQTKLLNIPGLSKSFVVMDDDLFLTAPWQLADFIGEDGAEVVSGSSLAGQLVDFYNSYLIALRELHGVFADKFGAWDHYVPAHGPHFMQRQWLQKLMLELPELYNKTAAHKLRSGQDVVMAAAYEWYVDQHQPGHHRRAADSRAGFIGLGDELVGAALVASATDQPAAVGKGPAMTQLARGVFSTWQQTWTRRGTKVICINDDITELFKGGRDLVAPVVREFLAQHYPKPSQYELPPGNTNSCRRLKPAFGKLPTRADIEAACEAPHPAVAAA